MTAPVFGNCGGCAAWGRNDWHEKRLCRRHPPAPTEVPFATANTWTRAMDGCFDWLPILPTEKEKNDDRS